MQTNGQSGHLLLPAEIVERGQAQLAVSEPFTVLEHARHDLDAFYDHRSAAHLPTKREINPNRAERAIDRALCSIPFGVMVRAAIFHALDFALTYPVAAQESLLGARGVDYTHNASRPYWPESGQHVYLTMLVRRLDEALVRFYREPRSTELLGAFREPYIRAYEHSDECASLVNGDEVFDRWSPDPQTLLDIDGPTVSDVNRVGCRHFADVVMHVVRAFPISIVDAFEDADESSPTMTILELQRQFLRAIPVLAKLAGLHARGETESPSGVVQHRDRTILPGELVCDLYGGGILGFHWSNNAIMHSTNASRCPGRSCLPPLSHSEERTMHLLESLRLDAQGDVSITAISTVEVMLHLAVVDAPLLWVHQLEAHQLCPEFEDFRDWNKPTVLDMCIPT